VSLDRIADLTLEDVGAVFDYVMQSSKDGFNPTRFQNRALPRVKKVLESLDSAVEKSRGSGLAVQRMSAKQPIVGGTDAFLFCAAMRVFAEWRILRQVPDGYKGYAVGMSLGQKDVVQNVAKMERAAQAWIDHRSEFGEEPISPTLRDILQYEIDVEEHPNLPRLQESSGAMGLLWVRRQLQYQTVIFENVLEVPTSFPEAHDAVASAYTTVYGQYHGWAVQKIFRYSFQASPPVEVIYNFMNPHKLEEVKQIARTMTSSTETEENGGESEAEVTSNEEQQPPENIFHRIGWETQRIVDGIVQKFGGDKNKKRNKGENSDSGLVGAELEEFINAEMTQSAHDHIMSYLEVAKPLLVDMSELFDEMNMDDPSKV
jgi:Glycolipid transfer protein (GLTP)